MYKLNFALHCHLFSDNIVTNEMKNVFKGNYEGVIQNMFLCLFKELEHLNKLNFGSNVVEYLSDFLKVNPQE